MEAMSQTMQAGAGGDFRWDVEEFGEGEDVAGPGSAAAGDGQGGAGDREAQEHDDGADAELVYGRGKGAENQDVGDDDDGPGGEREEGELQELGEAGDDVETLLEVADFFGGRGGEGLGRVCRRGFR